MQKTVVDDIAAGTEILDLPTILKPAGEIRSITPDRKSLNWKSIVFLYFILISVSLICYKVIFFDVSASSVFCIYGITVTSYLMSRFAIVLFYKPTQDKGYRPKISIIIPAMNEEEVITRTLLAAVNVDYPKDKLEIIVIDDGSTDYTWYEIETFRFKNPKIKSIRFARNQGKREAMVAGIENSTGEVLVFIDSDSIVDPESFKYIVQDFVDSDVAAVVGRADVYNSTRNMLTRMQTVRYFTAFEVIKACESVFDAVTCCSGCFSAYRREYVLEVFEAWRNQTFCGIKCTYGDDRSLTNRLLKDYKIRYNSLARAYTVVPDTWRKFLKQQLRWKKSWTRETLIALGIFWKKHPVFALSAYVSAMLPVVSPLIAMRSAFYMPAITGEAPWLYMLGIYVMAILFGLFYCFKTPRRPDLWIYGALFSLVYVLLLWQTYYAIMTIKDARWGTRG